MMETAAFVLRTCFRDNCLLQISTGFITARSHFQGPSHGREPIRPRHCQPPVTLIVLALHINALTSSEATVEHFERATTTNIKAANSPEVLSFKMALPKTPIVVLFGYEASTFTLKIRLALKLKQIPYTFVAVPSMMPRPLLKDNFNLTYRKIPVLAMGREVYCDTSLIIEALEHFFPESEGYQSLYPLAADGRNYRALIRGFASYWTDRPLFRITCGLMPASIWRSSFGRDREGLIGHKIDAEKLEKKLPENLSRLDQQLSMIEPLFENQNGGFVFSTPAPSLADISLYYQLEWGSDMAAGRSQNNLTGGETKDTDTDGVAPVFNMQRYPGTFTWFGMMKSYFDNLPSTEKTAGDFSDVLKQMKEAPNLGPKSLLLPTPNPSQADLDKQSGLTEGAVISVVPDDTGRDEYVASGSSPP